MSNDTNMILRSHHYQNGQRQKKISVHTIIFNSILCIYAAWMLYVIHHLFHRSESDVLNVDLTFHHNNPWGHHLESFAIGANFGDYANELNEYQEIISLFDQPIGSIRRVCPIKKNVMMTEASTYQNREHSCWLPTNHEENCSDCTNNGPMPIRVRPWMKKENHALEHYSILLLVSSHTSQPGPPTNNIRIIGWNSESEMWENASDSFSFPKDSPCESLHSPSIHVDDENMSLYMYLHGHKCEKNLYSKRNFQPTLLFLSNDSGASWTLLLHESKELLIPSPYLILDLFYLSVPVYSKDDNYYYAMAKTQDDPVGSAILCRSKNLSGPFEQGPILARGMRHVDMHIVHRMEGDRKRTFFFVFYTLIGDLPEKVMLGNIDVSVGFKDWMKWKMLPGPIILKPQYWYEHGGAPPVASKPGAATEILYEIRDPHFLPDDAQELDDGALIGDILSGLLFYTVQGENRIAMAKLSIDWSRYFEKSIFFYRDHSHIRSDVFPSTSLEVVMNQGNYNNTLLITGVGRSGTTSLCTLFQSMGIFLSHDNDVDCGPYPGPDGAVSWYDAFKDKDKNRMYSNVVHLVRDPLKVIDSRAHKCLLSSSHRSFLISTVGVHEETKDLIGKDVITLKDCLKFSLKHWVRRNSFVENFAIWRSQIEGLFNDPLRVWQLCMAGGFGSRCPRLDSIQEILKMMPQNLNSNYVNTTLSKFQTKKNPGFVYNFTKSSWISLKEIVGTENFKYIQIAQDMARRYGYYVDAVMFPINYTCRFTQYQGEGQMWDCFLSAR